MSTNSAYINYKRYGVRFDLDERTFSLFYDPMGCIVENASITQHISAVAPQPKFEEYDAPTVHTGEGEDSMSMNVVCSGSRLKKPDFMFWFHLCDEGIHIGIGSEHSASTVLSGHLRWGMHDQKETMAVCYGRETKGLRAASGPAVTEFDDALFDRDTDSVLTFSTFGKFSFHYDWDKEAYAFDYNTLAAQYGTVLTIGVKEHAYEKAFGVDYRKRNPKTTFSKPPVGWMTWYAVQMETCEENVLANARFQYECLKKFGADTIWIDAEWRHQDVSAVGKPYRSNYLPDPNVYPHGMKHISDKIREYGFVPALWIAPTCDTVKNELMKKYPDAVMVRTPRWCGQYFFDLGHKDFLDAVLPYTVEQTLAWGYDAIKWDALPETARVCAQNFGSLTGSPVSPRSTLKKAFDKARRAVGDDYYLLYCAGESERDVDLACGSFDAVRIGGDIFHWSEFISECVDKIFRYYSLHNVVLYCDTDNVILRRKFNTYDQAVTRACIVSMLGLPYTFGDDLTALPDERVEIIRRTIPPVPASPMDIRYHRAGRETAILSLAVERPFGRWHVADLINLSGGDQCVRIDFAGDLGLSKGRYHVYDYWNREYLGLVEDGFQAELRTDSSRVFAIHAQADIPQVISTSRHISQGAVDLLQTQYNGKTLSGRSDCVAGDPYEIIIAVPDAYDVSSQEMQPVSKGIWKLSLLPETTGETAWFVKIKMKAARKEGGK